MLDFLGELKRTHYCGDLRATHEGQSVVLLGWVHGRRDLGHLIFLDIRDRAGIAQVVFNKETGAAAHAKAEQVRSEFVVAVEGRVARRQKANPGVPTGEVEVIATSLLILNTSKTPPFPIEEQINATEETRLRYRYLDLRRPKPHANLALRHRMILELRRAMDELGFYEVETPMLTRSTPEGALDYEVPSRVHPGLFYALPQSPQIFKQILMISGFDKYFQIARCFRDEDLRADRQPDFTQLDLEMSFVRPEDVWDVIEKVTVRMWAVGGHKVSAPFRRMKYRDALRRYGSDKPDLRFGMELQDVTSHFARPEAATLQITGSVYALVAPGAAEKFSRKHVDELTERAKALGARACYTVKVTADGVQSGLEKTLGMETLKQMAAAIGAKPGDLIVITAARETPRAQYINSDTGFDGWKLPDGRFFLGAGADAATLITGQLRLYLGEKLGLVDKSRWEFLWLSDFPLFEWDEKENVWVPAQHPFTGVFEEDLDKLEDPERRGTIRSKGYDLVLNGVELGSGSVRIHRQDIQSRVFKALGLGDEQARQRFGFFLDALEYGTPPHGGIALGLDRVTMLIAGEKSLREVIAFPKTAQGQDLMANAPSPIPQDHVEKLNIIPAFAYLSHIEKGLVGILSRLLDFVDRRVARTNIPAPATPFQRMCLLTFAASFKTARGILLLGKSGYGTQAQALVRFLLEATINLEFAALDESRASQFWNSGNAAVERLRRKAQFHSWPEEFLTPPLKESLSFEEDQWGKIPLREKAKTVNLLWHYDFVYALSSGLVHPSPNAFIEMVRDVDAESYELGPSPKWVMQALASAFMYVHMVTIRFSKSFGLTEVEPGLDTLYSEFHDFTQRIKSEVQ